MPEKLTVEQQQPRPYDWGDVAVEYEQWHPGLHSHVERHLAAREILKPSAESEEQIGYIEREITNHSLAQSNELEPIVDKEFVMEDGRKGSSAIYAVFDVGDNGKQLVLARGRNNEKNEEHYHLVRVRTLKDGSLGILNYKELDFRNKSVETINISGHDGTQTTFSLERGNEKSNFTWRFSAFGESTTAFVDDTAKAVNKPKNEWQAEAEKQSRKEAVRRWSKRAIGALAVYATVASGGVVEKAVDPFIGTEGTVAAATATERVEVPHELDGIAFKDYPKETQQELREQVKDENHRAFMAREHLMISMQDLDEHKYDAIRQRASKYEKDHANELLGEEMIIEFTSRLESARTHVEVMSVLQEFTEFYGLSAGFQERSDHENVDAFDRDIGVEATKYTAATAVKTIGSLPVGLVKDMNLERIEIGRVNPGISPVMGVYRGNDRSLSIAALSSAQETGMKTIAILESGSPELESTIIHELAHALTLDDFGQLHNGHNLNDEELSIIKATPSPLSYLRDFVNYPEAISMYGQSEDVELVAENMSGVMSERSDGLAHPDEIRRFNSPANKMMLQTLFELERKYPGIADHIISKNDRLMSRSNITIGR